jgi:histidinol-phosphate aminotransferase
MAALVTDSIASLRPYQAGTPIEVVAKQLGLASTSEIVKLASNENPLGPSPAAIAAASKVLLGVHRYPDPASPDLTAALSAQLGVQPAEVVVGNGSNELLDLLVRTFCTERHHVVFGEPAFVVYRLACLAHGVAFSAVPLAGWTHDLQAMAAAITADTRLVFIANPNNPTGTHVGLNALSDFLRRVPRDVLVVLDEAYAEYAEAEDYPDGLKLRELHPLLVVVRTFSKIHGLAGFRVGYAVMPEMLAGYVHRVRAPFNVNSLAQAAAVAALGDPQHVRDSHQLNSREKVFMTAQLEALGVEVVPSEANFLLVDIHRDGALAYDGMLRHGVIVRALPPLPTCLRITLGTRKENERCVTALRAVLS